jgi:uncharacterized protein (DUF1778 family)
MSIVKNNPGSMPSRMNIRMAVEIKERISKAAALSGQDLTEFAVVTLSEKATEIINQHDQLLLGSEDHQFFLNALSDSGSEPSARSKSIAKKYRQGTRKGVRYQLAD